MKRSRWIIAGGAVVVGLGVTAASLWMRGDRQTATPQGLAGRVDRRSANGAMAGRKEAEPRMQPTSTLGSSPLARADLSGAWRISIPGKAELAITLEPTPDHGYHLSSTQRAVTVFDGDYQVQGDSLVMIASPTSYRGFVWRRGAWSGEGSPGFELLTTAYAGATMMQTGRKE